ncbi:hypothetical protein [uncultured Maribacter sp.]|uniref:hypothetical protein n=1 Tax=uncultured Maribacter sp. TaxID=431308 RepID=UPI00262FD369|nr:hypothetical protein [uncultured Maribacter sp.]
MKKTLKTFLLLSITSLIGYWGYTWYCNTASLVGVIHKDADSVIKISVHDIKKTVLLDAITSPRYYYNNVSFKKKETRKDTIDKKGVDFLPYNLVLFTVPNIKDTYFSVLHIKDANAFKNQLEHYIGSNGSKLQTNVKNNTHWLENKKQHWVCAWNTEKLIVSFGLENSYEKSKEIFLDVLKEDKVIQSKENNWIISLSEAKGHITYFTQKSKVELQFKDGETTLEGIIQADDQVYPEKVTYTKIPEASVDFYWDANFKNKDNTKQFIKSWRNSSFLRKMNIDLPQVTELTNGFFYLGIDGITKQTDTIVTYTYDDNFNKKEQKARKEKEVPNMILNLGKNKKGLKDYLLKQNLITKNQVFIGIPLYQFYIDENSEHTTFKTGTLNSSLGEVTSTNFMSLSVNFEKAKEDLQIPQLRPYFNLLKELQLSARQSTKKQVVLEGNIQGKKEDINFLSQLFFGLKED